MRLEVATKEAIRYACIKFHYARKVPAIVTIAYSVYNDNNEWCGIIAYNLGARCVGEKYNLRVGQTLELIRMALNGKQQSTSKALSISMKLIKKHRPSVKLLVSYADTEAGHVGTIYQATNWIYEHAVESHPQYMSLTDGRLYNMRAVTGPKRKKLKAQCVPIPQKEKHKYIYPLCDSIRDMVKPMPYPKHAAEVHQLNASQSSEEVGGANPTRPLKLQRNNSDGQSKKRETA